MTLTTPTKAPKLIHIAKFMDDDGNFHRLFLKKLDDRRFTWFIEDKGKQTETTITGQTIEDALRLAVNFWKGHSFRFLMCGFRYTLPERDEHGINALFHQMCDSYGSMNGIYYDEELGNNCFVQNASNEALEIFYQIRKEASTL